MRTKRTLLNLAYALLSSVVVLVLGLVTRKLLVVNFGPTVSGAASVVEKLFTFFSIAEFGVGSVISYRLYEQVAAKDTAKICKYMSMYKWSYRVVGVVICLLALVCALALPWIMPGEDMPTVYTIYFLNVVSTLSSYFLVTRRLMYTCTQQGYLCTRIDLCCTIFNYLARIAVAQWLPNYVLYFSVTIVTSVTANLIIARRYRRDFPALHEVRVSLQDFRELGIFHDLRYFLVHRLSNTIYGSSDVIVTSRMEGSMQVTNLGSYTTISDNVTNIGNKIMDSFASAIGSIVYDKNAAAGDHAKEVFWGMDLFSYLFGSFVATAYLCLFQPFMQAWMGERYMLSMAFVVVFSLNEYIGWNHRMVGNYRAVLGRFEEDQWFMVASAVTNLALSFALAVPFGVAGIVFATVAAHLIMWIGRARVVCKYYMVGCGARYLRVQAVHLVTLGADMALTFRLCALLPAGWLGVVLRAAVVCVVPNALNLVFYVWTADAAYLRTRGRELLGRVRQKLQERRNAP